MTFKMFMWMNGGCPLGRLESNILIYIHFESKRCARVPFISTMYMYSYISFTLLLKAPRNRILIHRIRFYLFLFALPFRKSAENRRCQRRRHCRHRNVIQKQIVTCLQKTWFVVFTLHLQQQSAWLFRHFVRGHFFRTFHIFHGQFDSLFTFNRCYCFHRCCCQDNEAHILSQLSVNACMGSCGPVNVDTVSMIIYLVGHVSTTKWKKWEQKILGRARNYISACAIPFVQTCTELDILAKDHERQQVEN